MSQETMKALVYNGPGSYGLTDWPMPKIKHPTDIIGKVTLAAICTSDIHIVEGHIPYASYPMVQGHEFCVEVVETGPEVKRLKVGDRVVVSPAVFCNECYMCKMGNRLMCENGGLFGLCGVDGAHAEYIRIPFADSFCINIPEGLTEDDVILVPDMLATAWFGIKNAGITENKTLAVIGVGPVGMSACLLAKKAFGAKTVIAIDIIPERLEIALKNGVADYAINSKTEDVISKVLEITGGRGVNAAIETAGIEETMVLATRITKMRGTVSTVAVFSGAINLPFHEFYAKGLEIKMGIQRGEGIMEMIGMIQEGKIDPRFILTHKAPLNDIEKGYYIFGHNLEGCVKWAITPYER